MRNKFPFFWFPLLIWLLYLAYWRWVQETLKFVKNSYRTVCRHAHVSKNVFAEQSPYYLQREDLLNSGCFQEFAVVQWAVLIVPMCGSPLFSTGEGWTLWSLDIWGSVHLLPVMFSQWAIGYSEEGRKAKQGMNYVVLPSAQSSALVRQIAHPISVDSFGSFHRVPCNGSLSPSPLLGHRGQ